MNPGSKLGVAAYGPPTWGRTFRGIWGASLDIRWHDFFLVVDSWPAMPGFLVICDAAVLSCGDPGSWALACSVLVRLRVFLFLASHVIVERLL